MGFCSHAAVLVSSGVSMHTDLVSMPSDLLMVKVSAGDTKRYQTQILIRLRVIVPVIFSSCQTQVLWYNDRYHVQGFIRYTANSNPLTTSLNRSLVIFSIHISAHCFLHLQHCFIRIYSLLVIIYTLFNSSSVEYYRYHHYCVIPEYSNGAYHHQLLLEFQNIFELDHSLFHNIFNRCLQPE